MSFWRKLFRAELCATWCKPPHYCDSCGKGPEYHPEKVAWSLEVELTDYGATPGAGTPTEVEFVLVGSFEGLAIRRDPLPSNWECFTRSDIRNEGIW